MKFKSNFVVDPQRQGNNIQETDAGAWLTVTDSGHVNTGNEGEFDCSGGNTINT